MDPFKNLADAQTAYEQLSELAAELTDRIAALEKGVKPSTEQAIAQAVKSALPDADKATGEQILAALGKVGYGGSESAESKGDGHRLDGQVKPAEDSSKPHRWDKQAIRAMDRNGVPTAEGIRVEQSTGEVFVDGQPLN